MTKGIFTENEKNASIKASVTFEKKTSVQPAPNSDLTVNKPRESESRSVSQAKAERETFKPVGRNKQAQRLKVSTDFALMKYLVIDPRFGRIGGVAPEHGARTTTG
jgi:hypothetical protein